MFYVLWRKAQGERHLSAETMIITLRGKVSALGQEKRVPFVHRRRLAVASCQRVAPLLLAPGVQPVIAPIACPQANREFVFDAHTSSQGKELLDHATWADGWTVTKLCMATRPDGARQARL